MRAFLKAMAMSSGMVIALYLATMLFFAMALDALQYEQTGSCEGCLILDFNH